MTSKFNLLGWLLGLLIFLIATALAGVYIGLSAISVIVLVVGLIAVLILVAGVILALALVEAIEGKVEMAEEERDLEVLIKFDEHVRVWISGSLSDDQLRSIVKGLEIDGDTLAALIEEGASELTGEEITKLADAGIVDFDLRKVRC